MFHVIIPSARYVPQDLQEIGKIPAVIYPINQRIVFDYIYEQYKENCNGFVVGCCEGAKSVIGQLSRYGKTKIVHLKELKDLGFTVYELIHDLKGNCVINFGDTIVTEPLEENLSDYFYYAEDSMSGMWTFFDESKGELTEIIDKKEPPVSDFGKLFVGVFYISSAELFSDCLRTALDNPAEGISAFYSALMEYSRRIPLIPIKTDHWLDIGHQDQYYNSALEVKARAFNHISIDKNRGLLRKTSDDKEKFIGEIRWYLKLPADIEYVSPRLFDYSLNYDNPYVVMEYYAYHTVHELFLYGDLKKNQWEKIFKRIKFICDDFKRYSVKDSKMEPSLRQMYLDKTIYRLNRLRQLDGFSDFFSKPLRINGKKYKTLDKIVNILERIIPEKLFDVECFHIIHGDLCFSNIMVDRNFSFVKVIDPRGRFGDFDIYGDFRYELAKLMHSVDGMYDYIIKDQFTLEYDIQEGIINFRIDRDRLRIDVYSVFLNVFKEEIGENIDQLELIEALLFLSMVPLHRESYRHQLAMLVTGIEILSRVVLLKEKEG